MVAPSYSENDWLSSDQLFDFGTNIMKAIVWAYISETTPLLQSEYDGINAAPVAPNSRAPYGIDDSRRWTLPEAEAAQYAQDTYGESIPKIFADFEALNPCSGAAETMMGSLWEVAYALDQPTVGDIALDKFGNPLPANPWAPRSSIATRVNDIHDSRLEYWHGAARDSFETDFLNVLRDHAPLQAQVSIGLAIAVQAQQQVILAAHHKVKKLAAEAVNALDALAGSGDDTGTFVVIDVAFAAIGLLTALPTAGVSLTSAFGLLNGVKSFTETLRDGTNKLHEAGKPKRVMLGGGTVHAVVKSMFAAADAIHDDVRTAEEAISTYLDKVRSALPANQIHTPSPKALTSLNGKNVGAIGSDFYPTR